MTSALFAVISPWVTVWKYVLGIGLGSFFLLVIVVIPLGALDIKKLFNRLDSGDEG